MRALDKIASAMLGGVLAYAAFEWGGVVRTDQYHYLLVLGLLAVALSLRHERNRRTAPWPCGSLDPGSFARLRLGAGRPAAGRAGAGALTCPHRVDASSGPHRTPKSTWFP